MPIELHPKCKQRLIEALAEGLPSVKVDHGKFLNRKSFYDAIFNIENIIPTTGKLKNTLIEYIDEFPLLAFFISIISTDLTDRIEYSSDDKQINLTSIRGYEDVEYTARFLVDIIESLPWKYKISIELPKNVSDIFIKFVKNNRFSENIYTVRPTEKYDVIFPLKSSNEKLNNRIYNLGFLSSIIEEPKKWPTDSIYIQIDVEGFVDLYGTTAPIVRANFILRALCGMAIATRLFEIAHIYNPFGSLKTHLIVHKMDGDRWEIDGNFELESRHSVTFNNIKLDDIDGALDTEAKKVAWAVTCLNDMQTVFSSGQKGTKIILASQWLFDSHSDQDELLSFIQSMVVLEILLGDKATSDEIGLGELLRNRCAYLIGNSHQHRSEVLKDFSDIYRVRSQIVHAGKTRLSVEERQLFYKLRWMCQRVIQEEIKLLKVDLEKASS